MNQEEKCSISFFTVSFAKGFTSPNIPLASFQQGNKELIFGLDSCSENNVINSEHLKDLDYKIIQNNTPRTLSGVGGTENVQMCSISFNCDSAYFTTDFLISDSIQEALNQIKKVHGITVHGLLGSLFLKEHNIIMDFNNMVAYSRV